MTYMWKMALFYPFISRIRCTKEWYSRLIITFFWECAIKPIFRLSIDFYISHIAPLPAFESHFLSEIGSGLGAI